jgi:cell division transport system ATP-binding protein
MRSAGTAKTMADHVLHIESLSKSFREGARTQVVLERATARIGSGQVVAITGRSGSGKSTLLNLVSGIDSADAGYVEVDGTRVSELAEPARTLYRRAHVGFVYQFFNLIPTLSAVENVRLVLELNGVGAADARARSRAALAEVGLLARAASAVDQLSGGEQQRVAIARAIVGEPALLLADEPTGNLDPQLALDILGLFEEINESGTTIFFATHDRSLLEVRPRRLIVLDEGKAVDVAAGVSSAWDESYESLPN